MIYADNSKPGCFTGFWKPTPPDRWFNFSDFLATQALPGSGSITTCIIQRKGPESPTKFLTIEKRTALAQIPGLTYGLELISSLPKPSSWDNHALSEAAKQAIAMHEIKITDFNPTRPKEEKEMLEEMDLSLFPVIEYCQKHNISTTMGLESAPRSVQMLLKVHHLKP